MSGVDDATVHDLLEATSGDLLAYFSRRVRCPEDAADLLAETLLIAWRRLDAWPASPERRRMWLFGIATNVLRNHRRAGVRRTALAERLRAVLERSTPADLGSEHAVRDAVFRLPEAQRELVMLVHWDGFTLADAAELVGTNPSTARSRYAAARAALRSALVSV